MKGLRVAILAVLAASPLRSAAESLPPRDECRALPGFAAFRARLNSVVRQRNGGALLALLDPDIRTSFGGENGRAAFTEMWRLHLGARSTVWPELEAAMRYGCKGDRESASMPYMFDGLPRGRDPFETLVVTGAGVALRERPHPGARILTRLNWDIVTRAGEDDDAGWLAVRTDSGRRGYVVSRYLRSPIDYRLVFDRDNRGWRITAFIAGD